MADILNESSSSRKYALSLRHLDYSGDLGVLLQKHSKKLERIYGKFQDLKKRDIRDNAVYEKFYGIVDSMHAWYEKAEARNSAKDSAKCCPCFLCVSASPMQASAKGLLAGLNKNKKKKSTGGSKTKKASAGEAKSA